MSPGSLISVTEQRWHQRIEGGRSDTTTSPGERKEILRLKKGGEGEEENNRLVRKMLGKKRDGEKTRVIDSSLVYCDLNSGLACRWLRTRSVDFYGDNDVWRHSVTFLSLIS